MDPRETRPSAAEAGGYSLVIAAGLAVALGAMWYSFKELLFEPKEQSVFAAALAKWRRIHASSFAWARR